MSGKTAVHMAKVAPAVAPKSAPPKVVDTAAERDSKSKNSSKMHKRSRSGCFTCRLRRKKCSEDKPHCRACRHLGLSCEYKRPVWWSDNEKRKAQKEMIKDVIKATKMTEKAQQQHASGADSPPGLTHSLPTSATIPDSHQFARATSQDSYDSFDFSQPVHDQYDLYNPQVYTPQFDSQFDGHIPSYQQQNYPNSVPYEVDIKTERQMFVNDVQTRTDTSISTFSTFAPPNLHDPLATVPEENWLHEELYEDPNDIFAEDDDFGMFDFSHAAAPPSHHASISVDEADRPLLEHFIDNVLPLTFPILDVNQPGLARSEVILPALESNKTYLHCALTAAAVHMKFTQGSVAPANLDNDIMRHRYATIIELCESFKRNTDHGHILDATLALIFFQSATSNPEDSSPDIPWHQHFMGAADLIKRLDLATAISQPDPAEDPLTPAHPPFSMSLAAWIDILGATMLGRAPVFADAYRDAHLAARPLGLGALMGCEDALMVLISEIACLDALKCDNTLSEVDLCSHITMLGQQMDLTEPAPGSLTFAYSDSGALRPRQLARNVSAVFRKAARIWLQSLVPGASKADATMSASLAQFAELLDLIPGGERGYDRSLVWPVMIAGLQAGSRGCVLRAKIEERFGAMGETRELGAMGRMIRFLREVWRRVDERGEQGLGPDLDVHWRDVMRECRLDFLPI